MSTPVAAVEQQDEAVRVITRQGEEFVGSAAVVAVPLNTLSAVRFAPALEPLKQSAADRGRQAGASSCGLTFGVRMSRSSRWPPMTSP